MRDYEQQMHENWIYDQLEPDNKTSSLGGSIYGTDKNKEVKRDIVVTIPPIELTEEEDNKRQDEYLKSKGI